MSKSKPEYRKMDPIQHILERPDMYVGSTRSRKTEEFIVTDEKFHIEKKKIEISPAFIRIFVEPLSNAIDNVARSKGKKEATTIKVNINRETGETTIWNDGEVIPIEMHKEEKCYNHTLIFGNLLTGSNYNDEEDRLDISGKNGLGIKLTSVYSTKFTVEGVDPDCKKKFKQEWKNNMNKALEPKITETKLKKGYTKVTYFPDFSRFAEKSTEISDEVTKETEVSLIYTEDILNLYKKYTIDAAMLTKINVYFNDGLIPVKSLQDYAALYSKEKIEDYLTIKHENSEVVITPSYDDFQVISFVNGIYTPLGGTHADAWSKAIFKPIVAKYNKNKKQPQINIKDVKQFFKLFITCSVKQPGFDTQSKLKLESPVIKAEVKKTHIAKICKWSVMTNLEDIIKSKELLVLKKVERKKRGYTKVEFLDSANNEGTSKAHECTLILVEGESAKTYAINGIQNGIFGKEGRDWNGIYGLRGKILNVRNSTPATIAKNSVVGGIIKCLGLSVETDYTKEENYKKLRYGRVLIVADQDVDGIHISALIQNFFHFLFPSLLKRDAPFLFSMQTPIVRVFLSKTSNIIFYNEEQYKLYVREQQKNDPNKRINKKYYKGLATNNPEEVEDSFGRKVIQFSLDEKAHDEMTKAFHKKYADVRKNWLEGFRPSDSLLAWEKNEFETKVMSHSDFINTELPRFSIDDCKRSIPNLMDGLKEGHRKVLYSTFLKGLKFSGKTLKVSQLAGYVSEKSGYHHGEQNLCQTITGMANNYIGVNNIPLFYRDGQFGTRLCNGKDAGSARYIYTKLDALTRLIFRSEDDALLQHKEDDGEKVEPYFYVPIIPMILVNGVAAGIGTGWSTHIPCYDPEVLVAAIKIWLEKDGNVIFEKDNTFISEFPEFIPWYRGYKGMIEKTDNPNKFISHGICSQKGKKTVIEELPVGAWTNKYKEKLEDWQEGKKIKNFRNHCTPTTIHFTVTEAEDGFTCNASNLELQSSISTTNMCLFTEEDVLRKFSTVDEIVDSYCKVRYAYYVKRKKRLLQELENSIKFMGNKKRFLIEIRDGILKLFVEKKGKKISRKTLDLEKELEEKGYDKHIEEDDEETEEKQKGGYDYLLRLQVRSMTQEKIDKLQKDIDSNIEEKSNLEETSEKDLWINNLEEFLGEYKKWLKVITKEKARKSKNLK